MSLSRDGSLLRMRMSFATSEIGPYESFDFLIRIVAIHVEHSELLKYSTIFFSCKIVEIHLIIEEDVFVFSCVVAVGRINPFCGETSPAFHLRCVYESNPIGLRDKFLRKDSQLLSPC